MTGLDSGIKDEVSMSRLGDLEANQTTAYRNFTPPSYEKQIKLSRDVTSDEVDRMKLKIMPGFRFSWWYTGETDVKLDALHKDREVNKNFVR